MAQLESFPIIRERRNILVLFGTFWNHIVLGCNCGDFVKTIDNMYFL